jgi:hypothetical protein
VRPNQGPKCSGPETRYLHEVKDCDVIVCWVHNWPECPLEVVALRDVVNAQLAAFREMMKNVRETAETVQIG